MQKDSEPVRIHEGRIMDPAQLIISFCLYTFSNTMYGISPAAAYSCLLLSWYFCRILMVRKRQYCSNKSIFDGQFSDHRSV